MSALRIATRSGRGPGRLAPAGFRRLFVTELRLLLREPMLVFWAVIFPIGLLIVVGAASGGKPEQSLGGLRFIVVYTPVLLVFTLTLLALSALPATLASYREKGYLKRLATTPVGAARLLAAQVLLVLTLSVCLVIVMLLVAHFAFDMPLPSQAGGFALAILLTVWAMASLGLMIASLAPTARLAGAVGSILFFPLMFFAGLWVPQAQMGATLRDISQYTPLGAAVPALENAVLGDWSGTTHLLVLLAYGVILCALSVKLFRWEPSS